MAIIELPRVKSRPPRDEEAGIVIHAPTKGSNPRHDAKPLGYIGGQDHYGRLGWKLSRKKYFGSKEFGRRFNRKGIDGFNDAVATSKRGPKVDFDIKLPCAGVPGLGETILFRNKEKGSGTLLGPLGKQILPDGTIRVTSVALAETRKGLVPVAIYCDVTKEKSSKWIFHRTKFKPSKWTYHPEQHRADVRALPPRFILTTLFLPLRGGRSLAESRFAAAQAA